MTSDKQLLEATTGEDAGKVAAIALEAVPIAGGVMSGIALEVILKRQNRRLNQFLYTLAEDLRSLESRINKDFLSKEDFQDLAEDLFTKAAETRQQEKLDAFRAIFLNTVLSDSPKYDEAVEIADLVNGWQSRHIVLMRVLADPEEADRQKNNVVGPGGGITTSISSILHKLLPEWDSDQIDRTWSELHNSQMHRTPGTKAMMTDRGISQLQNRLTDFGLKVAHYLTFPEQ